MFSGSLGQELASEQPTAESSARGSCTVGTVTVARSKPAACWLGGSKNSGHAAEHVVRKPFWGLPFRIPLQCKVLERASRFSASAALSIRGAYRQCVT